MTYFSRFNKVYFGNTEEFKRGGAKVVAYLDLIILLNWCFDSLLLYWTSILLKRKISFKRIFLGGGIGSILILFYFSPYEYIANSVFVKLFVSWMMILATFGFYRIKTFMKASAMFYFITFLTGGILIGLHYLFSFEIQGPGYANYFTMKSYGDPVSWLFVIVGFPATWIYARKIFADWEMDHILHDGLVDVQIKMKDSLLTCRGFIDTGNQLYEPITNAPVMIVSVHHLQDVIPVDVWQLLMKTVDSDFLSDSLDCSWGERLRVIPYKVIGVEQQLMIAFRPDWIQLSIGDRRGLIHKGLVAMTLQTVSHDETYNCIVHPRMAHSLQSKVVS